MKVLLVEVNQSLQISFFLMTQTKLLVLFLFILFINIHSQTICVFKGDHMLRVTRTNETETRVEFYGKVIKGWKGIIFCPTEELSSNCTMVVGYLPENVFEIDTTNLTKKNHSFIVNSGVENTFISKIDDILEFSFTTLTKFFDQWNFISFVESTQEKIFNKEGSLVNYQRILKSKENINEIFNKTQTMKNRKKFFLKLFKLEFTHVQNLMECMDQEDSMESI
jgi:hypothetical protein